MKASPLFVLEEHCLPFAPLVCYELQSSSPLCCKAILQISQRKSDSVAHKCVTAVQMPVEAATLVSHGLMCANISVKMQVLETNFQK